MNKPTTKTRKILRYAQGVARETEDLVVTEYPLTVFLNEEEFATLVCTLQDIEDLVIGFLASEGVLRDFRDVKKVSVDPEQGFAYVETHQVRKLNQELYSKRYITSCCGKSRQGYYFYNDAKTAKDLRGVELSIPYDDCFRLMQALQEQAETFRSTGGVHNAALCDLNGPLVTRMDIGRHNALDKVYGYGLQHGVDTADKIIAFSGRVSSEVLLKVAKIGSPILLSKSAPTELALELAEELGIAVVGFVRRDGLNVYTCRERIVES
ncbi:MAG TPA: formate dehydrogenase accessory sulfurtransferase FdhD [Bacilli bacterium]|nr:formate dehydrogenase accessory sulfurtransferase FdhD [Bacilli bacterium]